MCVCPSVCLPFMLSTSFKKTKPKQQAELKHPHTCSTKNKKTEDQNKQAKDQRQNMPKWNEAVSTDTIEFIYISQLQLKLGPALKWAWYTQWDSTRKQNKTRTDFPLPAAIFWKSFLVKGEPTSALLLAGDTSSDLDLYEPCVLLPRSL